MRLLKNTANSFRKPPNRKHVYYGKIQTNFQTNYEETDHRVLTPPLPLSGAKAGGIKFMSKSALTPMLTPPIKEGAELTQCIVNSLL
jgi:hypothetical protein